MSYRYYFKLSKWKPTGPTLVQAFSRIQTDERNRILKFMYKEDFKSALIGRLLLRKIVNERFKIKNSEIKLIRSDKNRPILNEEQFDSIDDQIFNQTQSNSPLDNKFDFNISHHDDYCVGVGADVSRIGVDIMKIEKRAKDKTVNEYFNLMTRIFTDNEWKFIRSASGDREQLKRFMRLWTLKESYVKADGAGLTIDTRRLDFQCRTSELRLDKMVDDSVLFFDGKKEKGIKLFDLKEF